MSPVEDTLTRIENLLEGIYDQIQAIRDENSQEQTWIKRMQKEVKNARIELKSGHFTDINTLESLVGHLDGLSERANAQASRHKTI